MLNPRNKIQRSRIRGKDWLILGGIAGGIALKNPGIRSWLGEFVNGVSLAWLQQQQAKAALPPPPSITLPGPYRPSLLDSGESITPQQEVPYVPEVDEAIARLIHHPALIVILGHRGKGKTALAFRLQELLRDVAAPYAIGLPQKAARLLPSWYGLADDFDTIPNNAVISVPESHRLFHARNTQSARGRTASNLVNLLRHRRHTLIVDVQNAAHLDRNILSEADIVLVKEPGPFQQGFERSQFKGLMDSARTAFAGVPPSRKKKAVWVSAPESCITGQMMENQLPSFWTESLSRIFEDAPVMLGSDGKVRNIQGHKVNNETALPRKGQRTSTEERRERARKMRAAGHSYGEIAKALGVGRSYAHKLVNEPTGQNPGDGTKQLDLEGFMQKYFPNPK